MAEENLHADIAATGPRRPADRTPVNHFDHIDSIIDAVFGPDDDGPVPTARTMVAAVDLKTCAGCGTTMPPGATFHLCDPCHWTAIDEAV